MQNQNLRNTDYHAFTLNQVETLYVMIIEEKAINTIEDALLSASFYIKDNLDAICDEDYWQETNDLLLLVEKALDLIKEAKPAIE